MKTLPTADVSTQNTAEPLAAKRVLHTLVDVGPASFGLGTAALHLASQQGRLGCQITFWSLSDDDAVRWAAETSGIGKDRFVTFPSWGPRLLALSPVMEHEAAVRGGQAFDIVHQHSIWTGMSRVTSTLRKRAGIPTVIAPHGTLTDWALRRSRSKKRWALALYEGENLRNASCLHAVAESEIGEIRSFGLTNPVALIPNAIADSWFNSTGDAERFRRTFGLTSDRRIVLFLSRVTPKKGIPMLLEAIYRCRTAFEDWILVIAGADEFGHLAEIRALIVRLGLEHAVKIVGPLLDQIKRDAFAAAEIFVLPSYSEGAPMVIPEALATGLPVLATKGSPWPQLLSHRCGWWTEISTQGIYEALHDALQMPLCRLQEMGQNGRTLIGAEFTWSKVAPRSLLVYDWLLGRAPMPDFVVVK